MTKDTNTILEKYNEMFEQEIITKVNDGNYDEQGS